MCVISVSNMRRNRNGSVTSPVSSPVTQALSSTPASAPLTGFRGLLVEYSGASAGYSLRKIGSGPVVRLRRASDNAEQDFTAADVVAGTAGSELVAEPDFATSTGWSNSDGHWSVTGGQAVCDGLQSGYTSLGGTADFISSEWNVLEIDIAACSDFDNVLFYVGSFYSLSDLGLTSPGVIRVLCRSVGTVNFRVDANTGVTCTINRLSVKPYSPMAAEAWAADNMGGSNRKIAELSLDSAFCTTWYDQSGNGVDATQAVSTAQPLLIRAGVTATDNGKAALSFDGVDDYLSVGSTMFDGTSPTSVFNVMRNDLIAGRYILDGHEAASRFLAYNNGGGLSMGAAPTITTVNYFTSSVPALTSFVQDAVYASEIFKDGASAATGTSAATPAATQLTIGARYNIADFYNTRMQELIIYNSDQSANRTGIETNINDHYGIY